MNENPGYDLFSLLSKVALLVPVVLVALVVMVRWGGWGGKSTQINTNVRKPAARSPSKAPTFNLTGPFFCEANMQTGTASAFIQDRNIVATLSATGKVTHVVLKGDCVYSWEGTKAKTGTKMCGVGNLLPVADFLISRGMVPVDSLFSQAGISKDSSLRGIDIQKAMESCKKQERQPAGIFSVPKGVRFVEKTVE